MRNDYKPCPIEGGGTVDEIVRNPAHNYVAAIGGDVHNYQRFPVNVDGRVIQYLVAGGGGAFMHATHTIPRVDKVHRGRLPLLSRCAVTRCRSTACSTCGSCG